MLTEDQQKFNEIIDAAKDANAVIVVVVDAKKEINGKIAKADAAAMLGTFHHLVAAMVRSDIKNDPFAESVIAIHGELGKVINDYLRLVKNEHFMRIARMASSHQVDPKEIVDAILNYAKQGLSEIGK